MNIAQVSKSALDSLFSQMKNLGFVRPHVKLISLRRNVRPGTLTEKAKFKTPIMDCMSFNVTFLHFLNKCSLSWIFWILSTGSRHSIFTEST